MEAKGGAQSDARGDVINILTTQHNMDEQQADNLVNQWDQKFQQTKQQVGQKTREVGEKAAHGVSQGALWGFIAMFLGLLVAAWGGWTGTASIPRVVATAPVPAI
jgi:preprotein translocase subunit SecF